MQKTEEQIANEIYERVHCNPQVKEALDKYLAALKVYQKLRDEEHDRVKRLYER